MADDYQLTPVYVSYVLMLNPMGGRWESTTDVRRFPSVATARAFYEGERIPRYQDGQWAKSFRQGGPLEWYNPVGGVLEVGLDSNGRGLREDFTREKPRA
jgi:hypothetical protein